MEEKEVEKKVWSSTDIINNRNNWTLASDAELLKHLESLSEKLFSKSRLTLNLLQSFENEVNQTCITVDNINNRFKALSDTQFIESKVEESPETETVDHTSNEVESITEDTTQKLKEALENGINVLDTQYDVIVVTDSDSENEESQEVLLKPRNPYMSRKLPYIIGSDNFTKYDHLGFVDTSSEDEEDEDNEENEEKEEKEEFEKKQKIKSQPINIENDLQKFQTQVIQISSSDTEDSDSSLPHNEFDKKKDASKMIDKDVTAKNPNSSMHEPLSFADHLNATLKNASGHVNRQDEISSHVDDIFSPPPFPSKDKNSFSSDEEKSDSSNDFIVSKLQNKKFVSSSVPAKSQKMLNNSDDNEDYVSSKSEDIEETYSRELPITKSSKINESPATPLSRKSSIISNTSQSGASSLIVETQSNDFVKTHHSSMKNIQNKNIITAINAELNAKLKLQKKTASVEDASSSDESDTQFQRCFISTPENKISSSFDSIDHKSDIFNDPKTKIDETKPSATKTKKLLQLFDDDDDDDDVINDLFKPSIRASSKTKNIIPAPIPGTTENKNSERLFENDTDLFSTNVNTGKTTEKIIQSAKVSSISPVKKLNLFDDDSDSGDDIFAIINKQKKINVSSSKITENSNESSVKSKTLFGNDDNMFKVSEEKLVDSKENLYNKNRNVFNDNVTLIFNENKTENIDKNTLNNENDPVIIAKKEVNEDTSQIIHEESKNLLKSTFNKEDNSVLKNLIHVSQNKEDNVNNTILSNKNLFQKDNELFLTKEETVDLTNNVVVETKEEIEKSQLGKSKINNFEKSVLELENENLVLKKQISSNATLFEKEPDIFETNKINADVKKIISAKRENFSKENEKSSSVKSDINCSSLKKIINEIHENANNINFEFRQSDSSSENDALKKSNSSCNTEKLDKNEYANNLIEKKNEKSISNEIIKNRNENTVINALPDEQDGNLFSKNIIQQKSFPVKERKPGKLATGANLNINVNALLPGSSWSNISKQRKENESTSQETNIKPISQPSITNLSAVMKERVKISTKRRPPSRRARISKIQIEDGSANEYDVEKDSDASTNHSAKFDSSSYLSTTSVKKSISDEKLLNDLLETDNKKNEINIENTLNLEEENVSDISSKMEKANYKEKSLQRENNLEGYESHYQSSSTINNENVNKVHTESNQIDLISNLSESKHQNKMPEIASSTPKLSFETNEQENKISIKNDAIKEKFSNINIKAETSVLAEDSFSISDPKRYSPTQKTTIKHLFDDSDEDDNDLFSKLLENSKSQTEKKNSKTSVSVRTIDTSENIATSVKVTTKNEITGILSKSKYIGSKSVSLPTTSKSFTASLISSVETKKIDDLFDDNAEEADLFSSSFSSKTSIAKNKTSSISNLTVSQQKTEQSKLNDLLEESLDNSKLLTTLSQSTAERTRTIKNPIESNTFSKEKIEIRNKNKIDLFGEDDDELFSKPKKSLIKNIPKKNSLFGNDDDDDDDDLFGIKSSEIEKKSTDSFKKPKTLSNINEKPRVIKLQSKAVLEDPFSEK